MKQRSTTPVSKRLVTKSIVVATAVMMVLAAPLAMMPTAKADRYDAQINALKREISEYQAEAGKLGKKANSLQAELSRLNTEKSVIERQIDLSQAKFNKLRQQIKETEQKIADNKDALGITIADLYVDDTISPLEMLASSSNIGDYVDKQTYRSSISDELKKTINEINVLKEELEKRKKDTERVLADQQRQRKALASKEAERQDLLAKTKGKESAYKQLASNRNAQVQKLRAQQAAELAQRAQSVGGGYTNLTGDSSRGGYPSAWANAEMNAYVDDWGMYTRQCVSYAAFKVDQAYHNMPYWGGDRYVKGEFLTGNAKYWARAAELAGIPVGTEPKKGSVGVVTTGEFGHVAWVEAVNPDGTIRISHYNVGWTGEYAVWDNLNPAYFNKYIYFGQW